MLATLKKVYNASEEEKKLKKQLKDKYAELQIATKEKIETLSDEEICSLLNAKWVKPLMNTLATLPSAVIADLSTRLEKLAAKYSVTFADIEEQLQQTEKELSGMLDQLCGSEFDMQGIAELKKLLGGF